MYENDDVYVCGPDAPFTDEELASARAMLDDPDDDPAAASVVYVDEDGFEVPVSDLLDYSEWNAERQALSEAQRQQDRPVDQLPSRWPVARDAATGDGQPPTVRRGKVLRDHTSEPRKVDQPAVRRVDSGDWTELHNDADAIAEFFRAGCLAISADLADLLRPTPRGRLSANELERRDVLAGLVAEARSRGARLEAIGKITGRPVSTVSALETRGRALLAAR
jgi:hypothetical protein